MSYQYESYHYKSDRKRSWGYTTSSHNARERYHSPDDGREYYNHNKKWKGQNQQYDYNKHQHHPRYEDEAAHSRNFDLYDTGNAKPRHPFHNKNKRIKVRHPRGNSRGGKAMVPRNWDEHARFSSDEFSGDEGLDTRRQVRLVSTGSEDGQETRSSSDQQMDYIDDFRSRKRGKMRSDHDREPSVEFVSSVKTVENEKYNHDKNVCEIVHKSVEQVTSIKRKTTLQSHPNSLKHELTRSKMGNNIPTITNYSANRPNYRNNRRHLEEDYEARSFDLRSSTSSKLKDSTQNSVTISRNRDPRPLPQIEDKSIRSAAYPVQNAAQNYAPNQQSSTNFVNQPPKLLPQILPAQNYTPNQQVSTSFVNPTNPPIISVPVPQPLIKPNLPINPILPINQIQPISAPPQPMFLRASEPPKPAQAILLPPPPEPKSNVINHPVMSPPPPPPPTVATPLPVLKPQYTPEQRKNLEQSVQEDCRTVAKVTQLLLNEMDVLLESKVLTAMKSVMDKIVQRHVQNINPAGDSKN